MDHVYEELTPSSTEHCRQLSNVHHEFSLNKDLIFITKDDFIIDFKNRAIKKVEKIFELFCLFYMH